MPLGLLFQGHGIRRLLYSLGAIKLYDQSRDFLVKIGSLGSTRSGSASARNAQAVNAGGITAISAPAVSPAFLAGIHYRPQARGAEFRRAV